MKRETTRSRNRVARVLLIGGLIAGMGTPAFGNFSLVQIAQIAVGAGAGGGRDGTDRPALVLPESSDLNRVLRKVNEFFAQDPPKWDDGVGMLQDLLEGKVLEAKGPDRLNDPFYSVYSEDQRLFIPFARYCQRLVCSLPADGIQSYRFLNDGRAKAEFEIAADALDIDRLQRLAELYFATSSGPDIVGLLADLCGLRGELARAVYLRNWLLDGYPDLSDQQVLDLLVRQAHAFALLGDRESRDEVFRKLLDRFPRARFDVAGARVKLAELPEHPAFAVRDGGRSIAEEPATPARGFTSLTLRRLWRRAYRIQDPYQLRTKSKNTNRTVFFGGQRSWEMPHRKSFRPGLTVTPYAAGRASRIVFKDHDKVVLLDALSGRRVAESRHSDYYKPSQQNAILQRLPVTDVGLQRIALDGNRLYATVDNKLPQQNSNTEYPFRNKLLCYDVRAKDEVWTFDPTGKDRVFFQTAPVAYRGWLYAPVRKKRSFCLAQLDARDGSLVSTVTVHSGGTTFLRVPSVPPVRVGNQLIYLTNAGAVAAFSLPHLELRWLRAYETRTRHQPVPRARRSTRRNWWGVREISMVKWRPIAPIVFEGKVILAPTDSDSLLCLDVHSGRALWMLPRINKKRNASFHDVLVGDGRLYLIGDQMQCVDIASGKRLWEVSLEHPPEGRIEGSGTVVGGHVYLPYKGGVYRFRCSDGAPDGVAPFPASTSGEPNWGMPVRLQVVGAILIAISESGITAYSAPADLVAAATDDLDKARRLAAAGQLAAASDALGRVLTMRQDLSRAQGDRVLSFYIRLVGEVAKAERKAHGSGAAIAVLDASAALLARAKLPADPRLSLFRIECLDAEKDAKKIRTLREQLADLSLRELGVKPSSDTKKQDDK